MKAYQTPEIVLQNIKTEDIMALSQEKQYFENEGTDNLVFNWNELS